MAAYSIHLTDGALQQKFGTPIILRPSKHRWTLLAWLIRETSLHLCTSDTLSEFLAQSNLKMPKSSTKNAKIRKLLSIQEVTTQCSPEEIQRMEQLLQEMEQKRKKQAAQQNADENEEEDDEALLKQALRQ